MDISNDGKTLDVRFMEDSNGGNYVEIPIEFVKEKLQELKFTKDKPDFACIFLAKHKSEYSLYKFCWEIGGYSENDTPNFYLAWFELSNDSSEYDSYDECAFDEYLVLEKLPTMEETHKAWLEQNKEHF